MLSEIKHVSAYKEVYKCCIKIIDKLEEGKTAQQNTAEFMNFIIQDLLDFSQIKNGKFRQNFQQFDIFETIFKVMQIQEPKAKVKDIEFYPTFEGSLGNESSHVICCDEQRIMQVLLGLQTNALKFT